jgi:Flp pilus assembly protein TadD
MSLIVDVLKRAQGKAVAKVPPPPFIEYPHEEGLGLRTLISKHIWLFRLVIGLSMVIILVVFVMILQVGKSAPIPDFSRKATVLSQESSLAFPEPGNNEQLGGISPQIEEEGVEIARMPLQTHPPAPKAEHKPQREIPQAVGPGKKIAALSSQKLPATSPKANSSVDKSAAGQREIPQAVGPGKKIAALSPKVKVVRPEDNFSPSGRILTEKIPSHDIRHHFDLAVSYQKLGQKAKAMEQYRRVIEIDPMNVEAHNNLGVIYKDMGRLKEAVKEFQTVLSRDPKQENALNNLGIIFYLQGNLEQAIQELRGVLDINPRNREAYINLGVIYKRRNRMGEAKRMFENAVSIDPYCPEAYYNLGLIFEESGDIKEAISHYQKFIELSGGAYHELAAKVKRHLKALYQSGS